MDLNRVSRIDRDVRLRYALISVADKSAIGELARGLLRVCPDITILSTGGTYAALESALGASAGRNLRSVSDYTGQPELQGGLVKTLDFRIYLGLLGETYNESHAADLERTSSVPIDLVVVNLYPFQEAVSGRDVTVEDARTHIDIGGPCMLRAAAKNFLRVTAVCSPGDYPELLAELEARDGAVSFASRLAWAKKAFVHTAGYDARISEYLSSVTSPAAEAAYTFAKERP